MRAENVENISTESGNVYSSSSPRGLPVVETTLDNLPVFEVAINEIVMTKRNSLALNDIESEAHSNLQIVEVNRQDDDNAQRIEEIKEVAEFSPTLYGK